MMQSKPSKTKQTKPKAKPTSEPSKLSPKMMRFCEEYLIDLNGTQAAIRSGYSEKTAHVIGAENLVKPNIKKRIEELQSEIRERNKITIDELIQTLAGFVRLDPQDLLDEQGVVKSLSDMPAAARKCIAEMKLMEICGADGPIGVLKTIKFSSKLDAIEKLMKHLGGYEKDNKQKTPEGTVIILPSNNR
jgi:phage terminase small subunit